MKAITGILIGFIWMIAVFLVGFITISALVAHANDSGALIGAAATNWTNFVAYMWIAIGLLALTPLIMVILVFAGLFGQLGGQEG
jgi:Sec-independent protein secretion pathway component TatC